MAISFTSGTSKSRECPSRSSAFVRFVCSGRNLHMKHRNLYYTYDGRSHPVINDLSCSFPPGSLTLVIGQNGGGKSTLIKLLDRLYDPSSGTILVNGVDLRSYRSDSYRAAVGCLWQDHVIYPLSISEQIALGDPSRAHDGEAIRTAADRAGCTEFIETLSGGFATSLARPDVGSGRVRRTKGGRPGFMKRSAEEDEKEVVLSGGQQQRLALARVFMKEDKADLLVRKLFVRC